MPLDNNLNQDLHLDVNRNVEATISLDEDDTNKFSLSTPKRVTSAYLRIWETVGPSPKRIVEDIQQIIYSWKQIRDNSGSYIDNVARHGRRKTFKNDDTNLDSMKLSRGGVRKRKLLCDDYGDARLHPSAEVAMSGKIISAQKNLESDSRVTEMSQHE
jgi:hypothetical protein